MKGLLQNWEIKNAVDHLNELEQVANVVKGVDAKFARMRAEICESDVTTAETHITTQTLTTCYEILKGLFEEGQTGQSAVFDKDNLDGKLK